MSRMVRKQVYLEPDQDRLLKQQSKKLGVTESDLIRGAITQFRRQPAALPLDRQAWKDELRFIKRRAKITTRAHERRWTRKEL